MKKGGTCWKHFYIVESNTGITALTKNLDIVIKETEDKGLYIVYSNNSKYYVDCYDPYSKNSRFWLIHTIEKSELADKFIDGIITNSMSYLDYLWMFKDKLLKLSTKHGSLRCIGVRHENSMFSKLFKGHEYVSYLSIKARGTLPKKIYDELESINALSIKNTSIEKIITSDERTTKLIEDIYRTGKFSVKGTASIYDHIGVVNDIREDYYNYLKLIEDEHRMYYNAEERGLTIRGSPLLISFKKEIHAMKWIKHNYN